jgi:hypothetical protein
MRPCPRNRRILAVALDFSDAECRLLWRFEAFFLLF